MKQATSSRRGARRKLPEMLRPLFWEHHLGRLSWEKDRFTITDRILTQGDLNAIHWLRQQLGDDGLRDFIIHRAGRGLSRKQLRFWELILKLPRKLVNGWLADPGRVIWDRRT